MPTKRDWITRMCDLFHGLKLRVIYSQSSVRDFLKDECDDSISLPTTGELLRSILDAQNRGMQYIVKGKKRKLIEKLTANGESRYELTEE
ncbi:MAG: hypothetical protein GF311_24650 [Candidatus Lokiarchaeota archaeon]|nr:hypothetical protein [Candidatus Lokiarchaeota archaeon]